MYIHADTINASTSIGLNRKALSSNLSIQILSTCFLVDNIKKRLRRKPPSEWSTNSLISIPSFFISNLDGLPSSTTSSRIRHELSMTTLFKTHKPENGFFDGSTDGQQAMINKQSSLFISKSLCNILSFLLSKNYAIELVI
jgi:hypothetical protein